MTDQRVATLIVEVEGRQSNLDALLRRLSSDLRATQGAAGSAADAIGGRLAGGQQQAASAALAHAQALARLASAQGDNAGAAEILRGALQGVDQSSTAAIRAQTQLAQVNQRLAKEAAGSRSALQQLGQAASGLGAALGTIGFSVGIAAIGQFAIGAAQQANALEKTQATLRAVAGDQATYNQVLQIAATNQKLFGGTLTANLAPLQQFLFIANRTGASLQQLNDVAQLLATVNPAEGLDGAGFSLSEALSGDVTSIVERFNLPRQAIRELLAESANAGEVLSGITALLAEQGVTAETVAAGLATNAAAFDRLGAAASNLTTQIGSLLVQALTPIAGGIATVTQAAADGIGVLTTYGDRLQATSQNLIAGSANYADYRARVEAANAALPPLVQGIALLSESAFNAQQILAAQGGALLAASVNAEQYAATSNIVAFTQQVMETRFRTGAEAAQLSAEAQANLGAEMLRLAGTSEANRLAIESLALGYQVGGINAEELLFSVSSLADGHEQASAAAALATAAADEKAAADAAATAEAEAASVASQAYADAIIVESDALGDNLAQKVESEVQTQRLAEAQGVLASLGSQVANGLITAANAASILAQRYGIASAEAARLIQLQATLARTQAVAGAGFAGVSEGYLGAAIGARKGSGGTGLGPSNSALSRIASEADAAATAYDQAVRDFDAAERRANRPGRGGGGRSGGAKAPKQTEAQREATRAAKEQERVETRLADKLADIKDAYYERVLQAEEAYQDKLLAIAEEYAERQAKAEADLRVESLTSRADFYDALTSSDLPQTVQQQLSAAYEQAFADAQQYAQQGKAALAAEYLALKQAQIAAELQFQEKVAAAREQNDDNEVRRLEQIEALRRAARDEELRQLVAGGDQNVQQRDESLADAETARQDAIADAAAKAGKSLADAQADATAKTRIQNEELLTQIQLLQQIANGGAGPTPTLPPRPAPAPTPPPPPAPPPPPTAPAAAARARTDQAAAQQQAQQQAEQAGQAGQADAAAQQQAATAAAQHNAELERQIQLLDQLQARGGDPATPAPPARQDAPGAAVDRRADPTARGIPSSPAIEETLRTIEAIFVPAGSLVQGLDETVRGLARAVDPATPAAPDPAALAAAGEAAGQAAGDAVGTVLSQPLGDLSGQLATLQQALNSLAQAVQRAGPRGPFGG